MEIIEAKGLSKVFVLKDGKQVTALGGIDLSVPEGQLTALVGPDGAGKTTLMRLVCGLMTKTDGSLQVAGLDVTQRPQAVQDLLSYMPQKFGLYEDLTVQENLDLYADLHGVPQDIRQHRFRHLLEMTELAPFTERLAGKLSGGMKQKLGLACTLVRSPRLLLLDEPTVGVDRCRAASSGRSCSSSCARSAFPCSSARRTWKRRHAVKKSMCSITAIS